MVHINGVRHCNVRYRQLHTLHEQLRREFHPSTLPSFPPKKILSLGQNQIEERRIALEKYLQLLSQDPRISHSITFNGFLLASQQETRSEKTEEVQLDVFLMNEKKISVRGLTILQTEEVLEVKMFNKKYPGPLFPLMKKNNFAESMSTITSTRGICALFRAFPNRKKGRWGFCCDSQTSRFRISLHLAEIRLPKVIKARLEKSVSGMMVQINLFSRKCSILTISRFQLLGSED